MTWPPATHQDVQDKIDANVTALGTKADTASLAAVATSGSYTDLTNKPNLSGFGVFRPEDYGAPANGVDSDVAGTRAAVAAAAAAGYGRIYLSSLDYFYDDAVTVTNSNIEIRGLGRGLTKIRHNITTVDTDSTLAVFRFIGTVPAYASPTTTLTANTKIPGPGTTFDQSRALPVTSSAGIAAGDVVLVGDGNTVYTWTNSGWGSRYRGEMARVESVATGTVTLMTAVRDAYTTAFTAAIWKPTLLSDVGVHDLTIYSESPTTTTASGLHFDLCRDVSVSGVTIQDLGGYGGIHVKRSYGTHITDVVVEDLQDNGGSGYGIILEGTETTVISGSSFRRCRHGVSTGGVMFHVGWTRNTLVTGCDATECTNTGFDTHAWTTDFTYAACRSERNVNGGFALRGERESLLDCSTSFNSSAGVYVMQQQAKKIVIRGLRSVNDLYGVQVVSDADGVPDDITIADSTFTDTRYNGIWFNGKATNAKVLRNGFVNVGASGMSVDVRNAVAVTSGSGMTGLLFTDNVGVGVNSLLIVPSSTETGFVATGNRLLSSVGASPAAVKLQGGATLAADPAGVLVAPTTVGSTGQILALAADGSLTWATDQTGGGTGGVGFPASVGLAFTVDPRYQKTSNTTWPTANRMYWMRLQGSKTGATQFRIRVGVSSGNISIGVYSSNGSSGTAALPAGTPRVTTGAVACPAAGTAVLTPSGGGTFNVAEGDWIGLSCDNTTAQFASAFASSAPEEYQGLVATKNTAHPAGDATGCFYSNQPFYVAVE